MSSVNVHTMVYIGFGAAFLLSQRAAAENATDNTNMKW